MKEKVKEIVFNLYQKDTTKAISILSIFIIIFFFDVIFLNKTLTSLQVPGVMNDGPYGYNKRFTHRALIDPGGSTWSPRPQSILTSTIYKSCDVPLWNPYQGIGQPLAANMDSNAFNPLRFILHINPSPYFWDLFLLFRLFLAGIFSYLFMRSIQISHLTSLFTAILFMFCGYFIFSIDMHHIDVEIFLPYIFLCFEMIVQKKGNIKWIILGSIGVFFTIVGGQPQSCFLTIFYGGLYFIFRIIFFKENRTFKSITHYISIMVFIILLGFAMSAVLLLPFYEFWKLSLNNHDPRLGHIIGLSYNPFKSDFISFFIPYFLGPIHGSWLKEYNWHILTRGYIGVNALLFSFVATIEFFREKMRGDRRVLFFSLALVLMIAKFYGLFVINWIGKLPILNMINYGKYLGPLIAFSFAVLAGIGLEKIANSEKMLESIKKSAKIIILIMICTFFYYYKYITDHSEVLPHYAKYFSFLSLSTRNLVLAQLAITIFFVGGILYSYFLYSKWKKIDKRGFIFIILSLLVMELFFYIPNPGILKKRNERYDLFTKAPYIEFLENNMGEYRVLGIDRLLYPDFGCAYKISDIRVLDALIPKRYMELIARTFKVPSPPDRFTGDEGVNFNDNKIWRILDLLGVKYILSRGDINEKDFIEDILQKGKIIIVPGQPTTHWINSSVISINGVTKKILFAHAPAQIDYAVKIPAKSALKFSIGLVPGSWFPDRGDGVLFEIYVKDGESRGKIFSKYIDPKNRIPDRKWFDYSLELEKYAGKFVTLSFVTLPGINNSKDNAYDWSAWGDIRLTTPAKQERLNLVYNKEIKIYENPRVFPRAFVAHQYVVQKEKDRIFKTLKDESFDLRSQIILEEEIPEELKRKLAQSPQGEDSQAVIKKYEVDQVECSVQMKSPGFLVLSDLYYPGWNAYVDGKKEKIYQTDYILRSVFLDAGTYNVKFIYEPLSFKMGGWISGSTALIIVILLLGKALLRQRKRKPPNPGNMGTS